MAPGFHRAIAVGTLTAALLSVIAAAVVAPAGCSAGTSNSIAGASHCQWVVPAACCDETLAVTGSGAAPKPIASVSVVFFAPLPSLERTETALWTVGHASIPPQRVYLTTVVLLL